MLFFPKRFLVYPSMYPALNSHASAVWNAKQRTQMRLDSMRRQFIHLRYRRSGLRSFPIKQRRRGEHHAVGGTDQIASRRMDDHSLLLLKRFTYDMLMTCE